MWDGHDVIIWGGQGGGSQTDTDFADDASYDPANHRWKMLPPGPLSARSDATVFWTGSLAVILGGYDDNTGLGLVNGATYDPKIGDWLAQRALYERSLRVGSWIDSDCHPRGNDGHLDRQPGPRLAVLPGGGE